MKLVLEILKFLLVERIEEYNDILEEGNLSEVSVEERKAQATRLLKRIG